MRPEANALPAQGGVGPIRQPVVVVQDEYQYYNDQELDVALHRQPSLVLITGSTGHVGFCILLHALRAGHRVRAAVRSEAKAAFLLGRPQLQALGTVARSRLSFAVVPDITASRAYNEAIVDVSHVIHVASPLVTGDRVPASQQAEYFIRPAVRGTRNILEAAKKSGTVRRVVITSSIVALLPVAQMEGFEPRYEPVRPTDRVPVAQAPYESEFASYAASKQAALAEAEAWMAREKGSVRFDVVHLHPSFVQGRNHLAQTPAEAMKGTNAVVLAMLLGKRWPGFAGATVHVDDVARVHVAALDENRVPGNRSYILDTPSTWDDAKAVVAREFPEAVERRLLQLSGSCDSFDINCDASATEDVFGIHFTSFDEQVVSLVGHFLELRMRKAATTGYAKKRSHSILQVVANA